MGSDAGRQRSVLRQIARQAMHDRGLPPGFSAEGRLIRGHEGADAGHRIRVQPG